jgi:long-chain acyl-CoA synthetase
VVGTATADALADYARDRLPPARRPKEYHVVADLPRTSTGKIRRLDLPGLLGLAPLPVDLGVVAPQTGHRSHHNP